MADTTTPTAAPVETSNTESTESTESTDTKETKPVEQTPKDFEKLMKKYKVKIDNQEMEVDEAELISNYQLRKASDKRFQEGVQARKQAEDFIRLLKTNPAKVLTHPSLGLDMQKLAYEYIMNEMEQEKLTPEQRKIKEYEAKLAEIEEDKKLRAQQEEEEAKAALQQQYLDHYQQDIISALETSGLPKTEYTVSRMIYYMSNALKSGYELGAQDVTDLVRRDYINDTKALYSNLDGEALIQILGDDIASKLRKQDLAKIKNMTSGQVSKALGTKTTKEEDKPKKMNSDEWLKKLSEIED